MKTADFDYTLPSHLIAQTPMEPRDEARLLVIFRRGGRMEHRRFSDVGDYLRSGDVLVANDSRVIPARLLGRREGTGGRVEMLLLHQEAEGVWEALVRPARRLRVGARIVLDGGEALALVVARKEGGKRLVAFDPNDAPLRWGTVPLPPYIQAPISDPERYQTIYARAEGSAAAPTAGLHFTPELMESLRGMGVEFAFVTLHIGLDTFQPVRAEDPRQHRIHSEYAELSPQTAERLNMARAEGRRIVAVGTTAVRVLEEAARRSDAGLLRPFRDWVDLFILPGHRFEVVDALITNFHLPKTTLLMLVAAFAGRELVLRAYAEAVRSGYRFYSFGDATLIV